MDASLLTGDGDVGGGRELPVLSRMGDGIADICFNRPRQLNAVNVEMAQTSPEAVLAATGNPAVRVIVLRGAGRAFMAGGDLAYFRAAGDQAPQAARRLIEPMHAALAHLAEAPQPVLA